jgi:hypothetical protein
MHMQDRSPTPGALDHDHKMDRQPAGRQQETGSATMSGGSELRHQVPPSHFATMNGDGRVPRPSSATMSGGDEFRHPTPPPWLRYHVCNPFPGLRMGFRVETEIRFEEKAKCNSKRVGLQWGSGSKPHSEFRRKRHGARKELALQLYRRRVVVLTSGGGGPHRNRKRKHE